ncbi:DegQ family serine endoprotease [Sulfuriferula sp.]|uniref:DegQ family serine endoprotease n=1 Tax=Sulfuriferula sp. TaxID=2025307 RepID=UPI00272F9F02|nr:DegQ family serine endoprotease [Sulfuriferula sp.]MDP2025487.1 DegQ family serine endoprotease [Sulfuriferula sp.]
MKNIAWLWTLWLLLAGAALAKDLPDFTQLVEQHGAAVVNITSTQLVKQGSGNTLGQGMSDQDMMEFFRRFMQPPGGSSGSGGGSAVKPPREVPVRSGGSGFVISPDGYIMTNAHVVDGADEVTVKLTDRREFRAKVIGSDDASDVALIKINATSLPTVTIGNPQTLKVGEWVIAIGSPFGFENSVTAGIVSAKGRSLPDGNYVPFIQTDVAINPGNSGGPLFNMQGQVVGINSQILSGSGGYMGVSFAIPIDVAMKVADQLKLTGKVSRGRLGVVIQDMNAGNADAFGLPKPTGALVSEVDKGGPADKAGVLAGDVVLKFDGKPIDRSTDLPQLVAATKPGTQVSMEVWRNRAAKLINVTVGKLADEKPVKGKLGSAVKAPNKLGMVLSDLTDAQRSALGSDQGVLVESAQGEAARAGVQAGDLILALSNTPVKNVAQFNQLLAHATGKSVALLIKRGTDTVFVPLRLP